MGYHINPPDTQGPIPQRLRREVAIVVGECLIDAMIDGPDAAALTRRLSAVTSDPQEIELALERWSSYLSTGGLTL